MDANGQVVGGIDDAIAEAGRRIADYIDDAEDGDMQERSKALYMVPHLMNVLREMYATPKSRVEANIGKESAVGRLAEVRQLRQRPAPTKKRVAN